MSTSNKRATSLERLPIEIFLKVFASFSLEEIVTTFSSLNSHIDSIIRCAREANHIVSYNDTKAVHLLRSFPIQISRLIITHSATVGGFTSLRNLRSLTMKYGTITQFNGIRPENFPLLEILHISGMNAKSPTDRAKSLNNLFQVILSNSFPRLRICTAVGIGCFNPDNTWTGSSALRLFILDQQTPFDYEQLRFLCPNLRQVKRSLHSHIDLQIGIYPGGNKRTRKDIIDLQQWNSEKFILESCTMGEIRRSGQRSSDRATNRDVNSPITPVIRGRILPEKDPYCFASFLIEIKLPQEYPFKAPEATILDRIYHPSVANDGGHCCCWEFTRDTWHPRVSLTDFIMSLIRAIDNFDLEHHCDFHRANEYRNDYDRFYEKALRYTLDYGRPRY